MDVAGGDEGATDWAAELLPTDVAGGRDGAADCAAVLFAVLFAADDAGGNDGATDWPVLLDAFADSVLGAAVGDDVGCAPLHVAVSFALACSPHMSDGARHITLGLPPPCVADCHFVPQSLG